VDSRRSMIPLTKKGKNIAEKLIPESNMQVEKELIGVSNYDLDKLSYHLAEIIRILGGKKMEIIEYTSRYKDDFIQFNTDWIIHNFGFLESEDMETFEKINEKSAAGAMIYFAVEGEVPLATWMAKPMDGFSR